MKIKNKDFVSLVMAMNEVLHAQLPCSSVKTRYWLGKVAKKLDNEREAFEKMRISICEKYCLKDEKGNPVIEDSQYKGLDGNEGFKKEMEELMEIEFEVDFTPMKLSELENSDPAISPMALNVLEELGFMEVDE